MIHQVDNIFYQSKFTKYGQKGNNLKGMHSFLACLPKWTRRGLHLNKIIHYPKFGY